MNPHKVAVISPGSFVLPSGRSSSVERVIEKMVPLASGNLDIRIYGRTGKDVPLKEMLGPVSCCRVPGGSAYLPSILRHLRAWRPNTVDVHNRPMLACRLKQRLPHSEIWLTLHSTTFIQEKNFPKPGGMEVLAPLDGILVNSHFLKRELLRRFPELQVPVEVNHLGVSPEDFIPRWSPLGDSLRRARLEEFGWSGRKIVLYIGRLIPEKGVHYLLSAVRSVIRREPDALFLIAGSAYYGSSRETTYVRSLKEMAQGVREHVVFLPFTPYPQISDWYNLADLVVVPSGQDEAFGLVNLEAMASGVPVIAARTGGIPEIIEHGHTGILIDPEELSDGLGAAIEKILGDPELAVSMGIAGYEAARGRFLWTHAASRWSRLMTQRSGADLSPARISVNR
ncbi:glycosyltransferase family 4 protein [Paenibacillus pinistramenti]|uniref:glycosyltransferase family 4 protein n=1 Tax=Paenibacillus pinistramenti TaxID=1768003 RepID=UPI001107B2B9|nr:glycosyltransferase family 4 protein [Paenibacillus pinistramenti]